ncbi:MAG TPA: DUF3592 domain-containing protein [Anaerolineales bacterium]|nr:DUF3592 domain-containing protein [Anaerolineales bacterium]
MAIETLIIVGSVGFTILVLNAIFLGIIFSTRRKMTAVSQWPSTMGTVLMSTLERRRSSNNSGYTNYPVVQYSYQISGQMYQGMKIAPGMEVGGSGAGSVVARYPAGAQVMVFYNPQNPSEAVLETKAPAQWIMWLVLVITNLMLCGMASIFAFAF